MACIEEIAYKLGYIDKRKLLKTAEIYNKNPYGEYLRMITEGDTNAF
jgi:glucose-1-phosphate thymidylyltransferase